MTIDVDFVNAHAALTQADLSRLQVPRFQRTYDWPKSNILMLFDDVFGSNQWDNILKGNTPRSHFVGAIVLARTSDQSRLLVLDGQQRLVTISLMYLACIHLLQASGDSEQEKLAGQISHRIRAHDLIDEEDEFELRLHLQGDDHSLYQLLVEGNRSRLTKTQARANIVKAFDELTSSIDELARNVAREFSSTQVKVYKKIVKVIDCIGLVRMVANNEGAAFDLFETLNDRGLALSAADLVKNKVLAVASSGGATKLEQVADLWDSLVDTVGKEEMVNFLRYHHIAFASTGSVRKADLYRAYITLISDLSPDQVKQFVADLSKSGAFYSTILDPLKDIESGTENQRRTLYRLNLLGARSCRPLVLYAMQRQSENLEKLLNVIETVFVRAVVFLEKNPNVLEKAFAETCSDHRGSQDSDICEILRGKIKEYAGKDEDVESAARNILAKSNLSSQWRAVLLKLNESQGQGGEADLYGAPFVHVEHIFPQNPSEEARSESGIASADEKELIPRLGNLTLLLGKKNKELSNSPYSKKIQIYKGSDAAITRMVAEQVAPPYNKDAIMNRTQALAAAVINTWPAID